MARVMGLSEILENAMRMDTDIRKVDYLKSQKVALQYIPEKLEIREAMPSTPSGKIQKFKLREVLRNQAA